MPPEWRPPSTVDPALVLNEFAPKRQAPSRITNSQIAANDTCRVNPALTPLVQPALEQLSHQRISAAAFFFSYGIVPSFTPKLPPRFTDTHVSAGNRRRFRRAPQPETPALRGQALNRLRLNQTHRPAPVRGNRSGPTFAGPRETQAGTPVN